MARFACLTALAGGIAAASVETVHAQGINQLSRAYITPSPEGNRYRLVVFGDSLGDGIWTGLYRAFKPDPNVKVVKRSRVSTGFVRVDYYDWNSRVKDILRAEKVHIAVVMVGANDMQSIRAKRRFHKVGTEAWRELYGRRIDTFIKRLKGSRAAIYWVGLPVMRGQRHNQSMKVMNEIFREKADLNGVKFIDTFNGFVDRFGRYSAYGPDLKGKKRRLRASDGVHFTMRGYRKLAYFVEREIRRDMHMAKANRNIPSGVGEADQARSAGHGRSIEDRRRPNSIEGEASMRRRDKSAAKSTGDGRRGAAAAEGMVSVRRRSIGSRETDNGVAG